MKEFWKKTLSAVALAVAVGLGAAAIVLGDQLSKPTSGLCFGVAGMLGGLAISRLAMAHFERTWTPEQRKEILRGEKDERNVAIREKAAYASWYWTLYLLWGAFFVTLVMGSGFPTALVSVLIVLHCVFLMVNMNRWGKRM